MGVKNSVKAITTKARRKKVRKNNPTTNYRITEAIFKRECKEFDEGTLKVSHDLYLGDRL